MAKKEAKKNTDVKRFGVGIRGAGQVAYQHAEAIEANLHLYVAAISSRSRESSEKLKAKAAPDAVIYDHYPDMLADAKVDIVSECMPNYLHATEAILALDAGKHLILEKPPAISYEELDRLRAAIRKSPATGVVSFILRWHPLVVGLKNLLDKKAIGDVYYVETDYWHGIKPTFSSYEWIRKKEFAGGAMITGGCHAADLLRHFNGEVAEVQAYSAKTRDDFDYPTTYVASVKFRNGMVGKVSASLDGLAFPYQFNIDILGTGGALRDNRIYAKSLFPMQTDWVNLPCALPNSGSVAHHPFKEEIDNLVDHLLTGKPILSDLADACNSQEVALAVTESARSGKAVAIKG